MIDYLDGYVFVLMNISAGKTLQPLHIAITKRHSVAK